MINYSKQSWHYRLNELLAFKSTIPNIFVSTQYISGYYSNKEWIDGHHALTENFCDYWRALFLYFILQLPFMFLGALVLAYALVFMPLFTITCFLLDPSAFLLYINSYKLVEFTLGIAFIIIYIGIGIGTLVHYLTTKNEDSVLPQLYDSWKLKYCPRIKFVEGQDIDKRN